ncbi:hypothetical protein RGU12_08075 [Fredinandcohnia sp. QZ13]|uniref:hypothetical protein n=1 Tax=Fredinandcohnia sp. QZ13 TaxID=3073144 RepID=UPI00285315F4|nr:hypothetical protein [Fredinandcohnia sp. QZ13]MDR4887518.1 hypothetical protein [Fredinandcohnia sp. QZ13]
MGTFYVFGIVEKFEAKSTQPLEQVDWIRYLNVRLDLEQYLTNFDDKTAKGELKKEVFEKNIEDFYNKLVEITSDDNIAIYFESFGTDIEKYQSRDVIMTFEYSDTHITLSADIAILFIEGKVLVEEFSFEPKLVNWLFRHANISNPLIGCVMSDVRS